jgi:predicted TPR repeat methyltransferase
MTIIYSSKELRPREKRDFYPTPQEFADFAVREFFYIENINKSFDSYKVLDPGCGTGVWGKAIRKQYPLAIIEGVDIKLPDIDLSCYNGLVQRDYLDLIYGREFDLIIGNPPYSLAEDFLDKSFELITNGGFIAFLLRSAFAESRKRYDRFFSVLKHPKYIYQSVSRVSFTGDGKSDNTAYSFFIWEDGFVGETTFKWLDWKNKCQE